MLNKLEALSVAEWRRAEAIKIAIMGRKGLGPLGFDADVGPVPGDFDMVMADARHIEGWLSTAEADAARYSDESATAREWHAGWKDGGSEQVAHLRKMFPAFADESARRLVLEFYRKATKDNGVPGLPLLGDVMALIEAHPGDVKSGTLAIDTLADERRVMRLLDPAGSSGGGPLWCEVTEMPGYRIENGFIRWEPGVWPPVTEEAAEPFRSGDVERTGDQLAAPKWQEPRPAASAS